MSVESIQAGKQLPNIAPEIQTRAEGLHVARFSTPCPAWMLGIAFRFAATPARSSCRTASWIAPDHRDGTHSGTRTFATTVPDGSRSATDDQGGQRLVGVTKAKGLSLGEFEALSPAEQDRERLMARKAFLQAGADAVIDTMDELPALLLG